MGAELVVAILVGPDKFSPDKVKGAKTFAKKVVKEAKRVWKKMGNGYEMTDEELEKSPLRFMMDHEQYGSIDDATICIENLAITNPTKFIGEFLQWWRDCDSRDTAGRDLPFKKDWKIVVCGETTGGGSPEGEGWEMVRTAEWFNLLTILGIK